MSSGLPQIIILKRTYYVMVYEQNERVQPNIISEEIVFRTLSVGGFKELAEDVQFFHSLH
jgi:hypothetical protein